MKILHCADIHLDSKMNTHFDGETAKLRRNEMLNTFCMMVDYASVNAIDAVIIAGDLFDTNRISATAKNTVLNSVKVNNHIQFYYLRGNHDLSDAYEADWPSNMHLFGDEWKTYELGSGIWLTGVELNSRNSSTVYDSLLLNESVFNIVTMHGQESASAAGDRAEIINLRALRNRGIDYLALGHVHAYKKETLDLRGSYCYPGCLEGRGFDECGEHGFAVLDIDPTTGKYEHSFVPFAGRTIYELDVDVSDCHTVNDMDALIIASIQDGNYGNYEKNIFKVNLTGAVDVECEKDISFLAASLKRYVFYAKLEDKTEAKINYRDYLYEESLKGAFVRSVMADDSINEEEKNTLIRNGIRLISGKELDQ